MGERGKERDLIPSTGVGWGLFPLAGVGVCGWRGGPGHSRLVRSWTSCLSVGLRSPLQGMSEITQSHFTFVRKVTERVSDLSNDTRRQEETALVSQPRTLPSLGLVSMISGWPLSGLTVTKVFPLHHGGFQLWLSSNGRSGISWILQCASPGLHAFPGFFHTALLQPPRYHSLLRVEGAEVECENGLSLVWFFPIFWTVQPARLPCPRDSPAKNPGVGCHFLLQGTFPTRGSNLHLLRLLHCRRILYPLSQQGSPKSREEEGFG